MTGTPTGRASLFGGLRSGPSRARAAICRDVSTYSIMETFWLVTCLSYKRCPNFRMGHQVGAMRKTMLAVASHAKQVNTGDTFSEPHAISALAALAQPTRLAIFRLLIKHEPIGITAGVIAETVGAPHNTLSSHLAILVRAGLLRSSRDGRTIVYRSDVEGMQSLISFLVNDCCNGHPELCGLLGLEPGCGCGPTSKRAASKKRALRRQRSVRTP
jgi:ArsR family transcriptional regulator, arsenate/arsenite/antimonite-responsive transcriptional repressor